MSTTKEKASNLIRKNGIQALLLLSIAVTVVTFILAKIGDGKIAHGQERIIHTYTVIQYTDQLNALLKDAETGQRGYLLTLEKKYLEPYENAKSNIRKVQQLLQQKVAQTPEQAERARMLEKLISQKLNELESTLAVAKSEGQEAAIQATKADKGKEIMDNIQTLIKEFNDKQLSLLDSRNQDLQTNILITNLIQWISTFFNLGILILAFTTIRKERSNRIKLFRNLSENNKKLLFNSGNSVDDQEETKVIPELIESLTHATHFIKEVGNNNYQTAYSGITAENRDLNQENLAGELIRMRDQLAKVAEEERRRNWTTNGIAMFADILRSERENLAELADAIISNLIKYVGANQGGLFILEDEDSSTPYLTLKACYAYDRKKYIQKQIQPGEGLIGQAYLEKDIIFLTEVPENYVTITSGLGGATPRCVLIAPLKVNEEVSGAIELVSFKVFEPHEIEFIQKVAESIASTISSAKTNEVTKRLLIEAQSMAEEMKAQEEEMRQNMEELSATQEEMHRKEKEYIHRIQELEGRSEFAQ